MCVVGGLDRVYEIGRQFRNESKCSCSRNDIRYRIKNTDIKYIGVFTDQFFEKFNCVLDHKVCDVKSSTAQNVINSSRAWPLN